MIRGVVRFSSQDRGEVRVQVRSEAFREIRAMLKSGATRDEVLARLDHETPNSEQSQVHSLQHS